MFMGKFTDKANKLGEQMQFLKKYKPTVDIIKDTLNEKLETGLGEDFNIPFQLPDF